MSFEGGYQSDVVQSSNIAHGGAIFITNIEAQEETVIKSVELEQL